MLHSKKTKRCYSLYIEKWNPKAKKFINTCVICGSKGYSPSIECDGFMVDNEKQVIYYELKKTLPILSLDSYGRCVDCAR